MPDGKALLVEMVKPNRGAAPATPAVPPGPHVQESLGGAAPVVTHEDMLQNPHDEDLFEFYATSQLALVDVEYINAEPETYLLPLATATGDRSRDVKARWPERVVAEVTGSGSNGGGSGVLYDAIVDPSFLTTLLDMIAAQAAQGSGR